MCNAPSVFLRGLRRLFARSVSLVCVLAFAGAAGARDRVDEVAAKVLRNRQFWGVTLSPDGSHLGMYYDRDDTRTIGTYDLNRRRGHHLILPAGNDIYRYGWLDGDRLIYSVSKWDYYHSGLFVVNDRMNDAKQVDQHEERRVLALAASLPGVEEQAVVVDQAAKPFRAYYRYRYNVGVTELIDRREMLLNFAFDRHGTFRVKAVGTAVPNQYKVFHRETDQSPWVEIDLPELVGLHGFDRAGELLYVTYKKNGRTILQAFDTTARRFIGGAVSDPHYAVDPFLIRAPDTGDVLGFEYLADRPVVAYLDPGLEAVAAMLARSQPDLVHRYIGQRGEASLLFYSYSDRQPGILHELNLKERSLKRVLETMPGLEASEMAPKVPLAFPARDGVMVRGYYTLPVGADPARPVAAPMIVIVHGGPRARDGWSFDAEVQFFAQLGYAVLQVNYRGSEGLYEDQGKLTFLDACNYAVEDVVDGTRWMVAQGFADPARLAIYGWSFGGYAAVACAARYPDLYRCAYAAGGVYDFNEIWKSREDHYGNYLKWDADFLGDLQRDADAYRAVSPVTMASAIRIPIHLLHGEADGVVGPRQSRLMHKALREAGKKVTLETPAWLNHGSSTEKERIRFTKDVYRFCEANFR
jgi:dienelactone hydrolase